MKRVIVLLTALATALALAMPAMAGGNVFKNSTSTEDGYPTFDSDMIDIEQVSETGEGVYVAVLDTGLVPHWKDYFPRDRVATKLGKGFYQNVTFKAHKDECGLGATVGPLIETTWVGSTGSTHGTHVTSTILGYNYRSNSDEASGFDIPPIQVRGIAPNVTVIPVKVLADYQLPALPNCEDPTPAEKVVFGTSEMVAAGIRYVGDLAAAGYKPMVINMSLGGPALEDVEKAALDYAIDQGVIIVASAGNNGDDGMGYPGAYPPVISTAAAHWEHAWWNTTFDGLNRMFWLQSGHAPYIDIPEPTPVDVVNIADFSSRELPGQELDVAAPGVWVRGPFPGTPGYSHLPWWSNGIGDLVSVGNPGNFYYVSGTSMASPHVAGLAALMLEKNPSLAQEDVENILKSTALHIPPGSGFDLLLWVLDIPGVSPFPTWGADATGSGLVQAEAALAAITP